MTSFKTSDSKRFLIALITIALFLVYIWRASFYEIPETNQRTVDQILSGLMIVTLIGIYQFFFGSSQGSTDKEKLKKDSNDNP